MPSLMNSHAGPASNLTWQNAARRVARTVGGMTDPNVLEAAKDALSEAIQDWNTEKDWRFLQVIAPDIPTRGDVARYDLPTNYKKVYDAWLRNSLRKLDYMDMRWADTILPGGGAYPTSAYTLFNVGTTGQIELLPGGIDDILVVRYYRPIAETGANDDFLDVPSRYVPGLLASARALMCLDVKDYSGADRWAGLANKRLAWAKKDDDSIPDEQYGFLPGVFAVNQHHGEPLAAGDF